MKQREVARMKRLARGAFSFPAHLNFNPEAQRKRGLSLYHAIYAHLTLFDQATHLRPRKTTQGHSHEPI